MRNGWLLATLLCALIAPGFAQKHWANAEEYELGTEASNETMPAKRVAVLLEWETAYPISEFQRERLMMLAGAYQSAGQPTDAFARALQLLKLDPKGMDGLCMVTTVAPSLPNPSPDQVKITEEAANTLLARAPETGRLVIAATKPEADAALPQPNDPETERVMAMLREWRRGKRIRTAADAGNEIKTVAEKALAWAKGLSPK